MIKLSLPNLVYCDTCHGMCKILMQSDGCELVSLQSITSCELNWFGKSLVTWGASHYKKMPYYQYRDSHHKNNMVSQHVFITLQWRHNGHDSISNHQPHDCFLNRLFRRRSKKTSKLHITGLCAGNSPGTGEFPVQMASNAENVSIWWCHHDTYKCFVNLNMHVFVSCQQLSNVLAFYPRPVLAFGYCRCLCLSVWASIIGLSAR